MSDRPWWESEINSVSLPSHPDEVRWPAPAVSPTASPTAPAAPRQRYVPSHPGEVPAAPPMPPVGAAPATPVAPLAPGAPISAGPMFGHPVPPPGVGTPDPPLFAGAGVPTVAAPTYATWGTRLAARMLDALFLTVLWAATIGAAAGMGYAIRKDDGLAVAIVVAYVADVLVTALYYLVGGASGQTLGKKVLKFHIVRLGGGPLGFWRSLAREFLNLLSTIPLMLGWLAPLWSPRRQTWHDSMTGAVAVTGPSPTGARAAVTTAIVASLLSVGGAAAAAAAWADDLAYDPYSYRPAITPALGVVDR